MSVQRPKEKARRKGESLFWIPNLIEMMYETLLFVIDLIFICGHLSLYPNKTKTVNVKFEKRIAFWSCSINMK